MTALPNRDRRAERRAVTRREIADRIGMRPPSLYSHFGSKNAVYDAMFAESWRACVEVFEQLSFPDEPRAALLLEADTYFEFATADLARYQLMNQRIIHDFEPSAEAF